MKRSGKWATIAFLTFSSAIVLVACQKPKPLIFKGIQNVDIAGIAMDSSTLSAEIIFSNPNHSQVDFKKLSCDIFANDHLLGHYQQDSITHIAPDADFIYPARMKISMQPILQNALSAIMSGSVNLHFVGTVKIGRGGFFVSVPIDFKEKKKLQL